MPTRTDPHRIFVGTFAHGLSADIVDGRRLGYGAPVDYAVVPKSLNSTANEMVELAALLYAGRPDLDMTARTAEPNSHPAVDHATRQFTRYASDNYLDAVALLCALSTRLNETAWRYTRAEGEAATNMSSLLEKTIYVSKK